ncbi:MAG TPA: alpha/beta hydrolase [Anaerolineae bacterium]|jgi:pimeloyl-ACP methyl ester carboxylesterase|nr:alpha/beta hydrolase [Anaerolineae bacterium]
MNEMERMNRQIKLKDGRMLGYAEYGAAEGKPILCFHGFPGSRLDGLIFDPDDLATEMGARLIVADRPGMGLSDFKSGRQFLEWPDDVTELADALNINRFAVLAASGGGPYGHACAYKIPEQLTATAIVCGMGPSEAPGAREGGAWTYPGKPSLIRRLLLILTVRGLRSAPDRFETQMLEMVSEPDRRLMVDRPELVTLTLESLQEALRSGIGGIHHEAGLYTRPWGFQLQDIDAEVHLWHGEQDNNVPVSVGRYVAGALPNCSATILADEGHFSILRDQVPEILKVLLA